MTCNSPDDIPDQTRRAHTFFMIALVDFAKTVKDAL